MRMRTRVVGLVVAGLAFAAPAAAQVVQSVSFGVGLFRPAGFESRTSGDVLVENLTNFEPLTFDIKDFRAGHFFGEWLLDFSNHIEVGAGLGYYGRSVPSVYLNVVNETPNGDRFEIQQDLRLRIVPASLIVRFLAGRPGSIQPYVGVGASALAWRYTESGEFVDTNDYSVFADRFVSSGVNVGGLFLLGARWPIGGDIYGLITEYRYQSGVGNTGGIANGFLADKIDLSGSHFNFGFLVRF